MIWQGQNPLGQEKFWHLLRRRLDPRLYLAHVALFWLRETRYAQNGSHFIRSFATKRNYESVYPSFICRTRSIANQAECEVLLQLPSVRVGRADTARVATRQGTDAGSVDLADRQHTSFPRNMGSGRVEGRERTWHPLSW